MSAPKSLCEGRYKVKSTLGTSTYAVVYKCYDTEADESVAVKVLSLERGDDGIAREMFHREVGALDGFEHDHVVPMLGFEAEEDRSRLCIVLELVPGSTTLAALLAEAPTGAFKQLRWRIAQLRGILSAVESAHGRAIIHRDVKPANVLFDRESNALRLSDFGIARLLENYGAGTQGGTLRAFYSPPFAAPEQVRQQDTSFPADVYAFGVLMASVLAWRLPPARFAASDVAKFLQKFFAEAEHEELRTLVQVVTMSLADDPRQRPKLAEVDVALRAASESLIEKKAAHAALTRSADRKAQEVGLSPGALFEDLNHQLRVRYEQSEERDASILAWGRTVRARLGMRAGEAGKLRVVDVVRPEPGGFQRAKESGVLAPFVLYSGDGDASGLIEFAHGDHLRRQAEAERRAPREEFVSVARSTIKLQRERMEMIRLKYRIAEEDEAGGGESLEDLPDWKRQLASRRAAPTEDAAADKRSPKRADAKLKRDELLRVEVVSVAAGRAKDVRGAKFEEGAVPPNWEDALSENVSFSLMGGKNEKSFAKPYGYDPKSMVLTLKVTHRTTVPATGVLQFENVPTRVSLDRQDKAVDLFVENGAVNKRLTSLLQRPATNDVAEGPDLELVQQGLEPPERIADIVRRAIDARDIFAIQGPPGTGKTTVITEIMAQILGRDRRARILLTSQANEAVQNALDGLGTVRDKYEQPWRLVRDVSESFSGPPPALAFPKAFDEWASQTIDRSSAQSAPASEQVDRAAAESVLDAWRAKLRTVDDVKSDFADSVHVWGATLLRAPAVLKRLSRISFDYVIVDEAAKATAAETLVALVTGRKFILVGDQRQLPPYLDREDAHDLDAAGIDPERAQRSLFEDIFEELPDTNRTTLARQFRMHRSIGAAVSDIYYSDIGIETGVADEERDINFREFTGDHRIFLLDVDGKNVQKQGSTSWWNPTEVRAIRTLLEQMNSELSEDHSETRYSVGVIAAYGDQAYELRRRVRPGSKAWTHLDIRIDTVDAFQGKQDDIILYSTVRANTGALKFISDPKRLNVAYSRAKRLLVLVGHRQTLSQSEEYSKLLQRIPDRNVLASAGGFR